MYDKVLYWQWVWDRCLEGATLLPWLSVLGALVFGVIFYLLIGRKSRRKMIGLVVTVFSFVYSFALIGFFGILGWMILDCSDGAFWASVGPAHQVHAAIKTYKRLYGTYPYDASQLMALSSKEYKKVTLSAKTIYVYNPLTDRFTWFVRPSRYYVSIFDSIYGYEIYRIPNIIKPIHWNDIRDFPPDYEGPWDKLPK